METTPKKTGDSLVLSIMFLTNVLLKPKSKIVMVMLESVVTGHRRVAIRERLSDKMEQLMFDPYLQEECIYKELKKIRSLKSTWNPKPPRTGIHNQNAIFSMPAPS